MRAEICIATGSQRTPVNKALQLQLVTDQTRGSIQAARGGWGDVYAGSWCMAAPPAPPVQDASGAITGATEVLGVQLGDQIVALGSRDVRWSKFSQDVKPGEAVFHNAFSARLFLGETVVALSAGGAFISFDLTNKKVGVSGYPATPGGGAPYLSIDTVSIGLVSATGNASVAVKDSQATLTGGAISLDANVVTLGQGATDFVALAAYVDARLAAIQAKYDNHAHVAQGATSLTTGPAVMVSAALTPYTVGTLATVASTKVKCA